MTGQREICRGWRSKSLRHRKRIVECLHRTINVVLPSQHVAQIRVAERQATLERDALRKLVRQELRRLQRKLVVFARRAKVSPRQVDGSETASGIVFVK